MNGDGHENDPRRGRHLFVAAALVALLLPFLPVAAADSAHMTVASPDSAPSTVYFTANVTGPRNLTVALPSQSSIDALTLDGAPPAWRFIDAGHLVVPVPAGAHAIVLHAELPGEGPWVLGSDVPSPGIDAPGLVISPVGSGFVSIGRPAPGGMAWIAVGLVGFAALLVAIGLAARDRRAFAKEDAAAAAAGEAPTGAGESSLLGHLRELQSRLRVAVLVVAVLFLLFSSVGVAATALPGLPSISWPSPYLGEPTIASLIYRSMEAQFLPPGVTVVILRPMDAVVAELGVGALLAIVAGLPVVAYELAAFIGPALLPRERRFAQGVAVPIVLLFLAGALFAWYLLIPIIFHALYGFAPDVHALSFLSAPDLVTFVSILTLTLGTVFEMPVVMAAVSYAGWVKPRTFASKWRHAVVAIFIVAAIVTPDPTVVSQLLVALPMCALYFIGLAAAYFAAPRGERRRAARAAPQ
ncbi:MAG: twin-arginine translocase subunit TatC [Thermoplasmatota archaeon]